VFEPMTPNESQLAMTAQKAVESKQSSLEIDQWDRSCGLSLELIGRERKLDEFIGYLKVKL